MNLHKIVAGAIGFVNPFVPATVQVSRGSTTGASGKRTPAYEDPIEISAQVQALTYKDLQQLDGLNLNGTRRAIYLSGKFDGVSRPALKGGDLITMAGSANAGVWLVVQVLEQWSDGQDTWRDGADSAWCKVAVTLQNDGV